MRKIFLQQNDNRTNFIKHKLQEKGIFTLDFETNLSKITKNDVVIVTPAYKWTREIASKIPQGATIFGGNYKEELNDILGVYNYHNFMKNEDFVLKNASYTAEAFLVNLISDTKTSLFDQKIAVLGSGRVAKAIWLVLYKLGVPFDVSMRNEKEINHAKLLSNKVFHLENFKSQAKNYDTIINTIPFEIFENYNENDFKKDVAVFELASKKCLNIEKFPHINYIFCPSLPSKYMGDSAGDLMLQFVLKTLQ